MVGRAEWPFTRVHAMETERGIHLKPLFGSAPNEGSTDEALDRILAGFKDVRLF